MGNAVWPIMALIAALVVQALVILAVRLIRLRRQTRHERATATLPPTCPCGYELTGLSIPRCPECGRAVGFDKSVEELGLTKAEIARLAEVRRQREQTRQARAHP